MQQTNVGSYNQNAHAGYGVRVTGNDSLRRSEQLRCILAEVKHKDYRYDSAVIKRGTNTLATRPWQIITGNL